MQFLYRVDLNRLKWRRLYVIAWPYNFSLKLELSSNETLDFGYCGFFGGHKQIALWPKTSKQRVKE